MNNILLTIAIAIYLISGVATPLLMTLAGAAGLANKSAQLYMLFYCLGPASVSLFVLLECYCDVFKLNLLEADDCDDVLNMSNSSKKGVLVVGRYSKKWLNWNVMLKVIGINCIDILAQAMNYTGSIMAGPTIFATIYSSLTIWTALYSRIFLSRYINFSQWLGVILVFGGVAITSSHAVSIAGSVFVGSLLVLLGSSLHSLTYVLNEVILTHKEMKLPISINCSVQGLFGSTSYLLWQLLYTRRYWNDLIEKPMQDAGTTFSGAIAILACLSLANLFHAVSYFYILKYCPGGSVSAGIMKGLQAVLVFAFTSLYFCGRIGGEEMCFTLLKFLSLCIVVIGVLVFANSTTEENNRSKDGYEVIHHHADTNIDTV